jgi:hypothetical protein
VRVDLLTWSNSFAPSHRHCLSCPGWKHKSKQERVERRRCSASCGRNLLLRLVLRRGLLMTLFGLCRAVRHSIQHLLADLSDLTIFSSCRSSQLADSYDVTCKRCSPGCFLYLRCVWGFGFMCPLRLLGSCDCFCSSCLRVLFSLSFSRFSLSLLPFSCSCLLWLGESLQVRSLCISA